MKFGEYLSTNAVQEWSDKYLNYNKLKKLISLLEEKHLNGGQQNTGIGTSLSVPRPTNAAGMPVDQTEQVSQEEFFTFLESEMRKIEEFTKQQVNQIREVLQKVEVTMPTLKGNSEGKNQAEEFRKEVETAGENFLKLEKYVNLNFTGFHKILKKHDRRLPNPCRTFYLGRLHDQSWVRGDYSDVIVTMSRVYSAIRGDEEVEEKETEKQDFVRSTRKYWVHTEDISRVKYIILQHLPVFLQKTMAGETDSQLVNSTYLDNHTMELYQGRLEKSPGAIALRLRWYGTGEPEVVFVERKTHRESWAGEVSVKERFIIKENQVASLMAGTFDLNAEIERMKAKGKSEDAIKEWLDLATEVVQAINSKQLFPTMRTQYMRTAFQIPFDATVRISLDTNLTMISERTKDVMNGNRWYRDPNVSVPLNEITRFPHGVLEVKLQLLGEDMTPPWVTELLESGMLLEVHKFSKFIHGCAVLLPEDVQKVPYWIDDSTLTQSITQSGAAELLVSGMSDDKRKYYDTLLPHEKGGTKKVKNIESGDSSGTVPVISRIRAMNLEKDAYNAAGGSSGHAGISDQDYRCFLNNYCEWAQGWSADHITGQKVEPKLYFANERTFIKWMQMAVVLSTISSAIIAFSPEHAKSQYIALALLPLSLGVIVYGVRQYLWRLEKIKFRDNSRWDDPNGPVLMTLILLAALIAQLTVTAIDALKSNQL